jgi:hypothetical protein
MTQYPLYTHRLDVYQGIDDITGKDSTELILMGPR